MINIELIPIRTALEAFRESAKHFGWAEDQATTPTAVLRSKKSMEDAEAALILAIETAIDNARKEARHD